jgi:tetratricopeptide (TPR) repeat protein
MAFDEYSLLRESPKVLGVDSEPALGEVTLMRLNHVRVTAIFVCLSLALLLPRLSDAFAKLKANVGMICLASFAQPISVAPPRYDACLQPMLSLGTGSDRAIAYAGLGAYLAGDIHRATNIWKLSPQISVGFLLGTGDNAIGYRANDMFFLFEERPSREALQVAQSRYESALSISGENSSVLYRLGITSYLQQQLEQARAYYDRALENDRFMPSDVPSGQFASSYWLARLFWDQGDKDSACKYMLRAMAYSGNGDIARKPFEGWGCVSS